MAHEPDRRSILGFALFGLGAIFSTILGVPIVCYVLDPRNRKGAQSNLKPVEGIRLEDLAPTDPPKQGVIRDTRKDGWTLYPNDVVGRVWVVQRGPRPANLASMSADALEEFNKNATEKNKYLAVFTTICPHLGCSVNLNAAGNGFACPCHSASFAIDGSRAGVGNPAARDMDTLEWEIDPTDPERNRILVQYQNFVSSEATKKIA